MAVGMGGTESCQLHFQASMSLGSWLVMTQENTVDHWKEGRKREGASHISSSGP